MAIIKVDYGTIGGGTILSGSISPTTSAFTYVDVPNEPISIIFFNRHSSNGLGIYEYYKEDGLANVKCSRADIGMRQTVDLSNIIDLSVNGKVGFKKTSSSIDSGTYYDIFC